MKPQKKEQEKLEKAEKEKVEPTVSSEVAPQPIPQPTPEVIPHPVSEVIPEPIPQPIPVPETFNGTEQVEGISFGNTVKPNVGVDLSKDKDDPNGSVVNVDSLNKGVNLSKD